jgi:translation initiation factor 2B subunit (eIF-2B alpha/beta/delta family)
MELFKQIKQDNTSGSGAILNSVQQELLQFLSSEKMIRTEEFRQFLQDLLDQFSRFGLLIHFIEDLEKNLEHDENVNSQKIKVFIKHYKEKWKNAQDKASLRMIKEVDLDRKQVLLHSHSSAIINLFSHLVQKKLKPVIRQTWSSPAGEGIIQAETLNNMGFETHLFHEDAVGNFIEYIDLVIFGADLIVKDKFLNKAGTYPLAILFHHHLKPVYVIAEPRKVFHVKPEERPEFFTEKEKSTAELYQGKSSLRVKNYYFDFTPLSLVRKLILE